VYFIGDRSKYNSLMYLDSLIMGYESIRIHSTLFRWYGFRVDLLYSTCIDGIDGRGLGDGYVHIPLYVCYMVLVRYSYIHLGTDGVIWFYVHPWV
jgi:hypothetical protein